jgi:hypothetical protein
MPSEKGGWKKQAACCPRKLDGVGAILYGLVAMNGDIILGIILTAFSVLAATGLMLVSRGLINRISRLEQTTARDIRHQLTE